MNINLTKVTNRGSFMNETNFIRLPALMRTVNGTMTRERVITVRKSNTAMNYGHVNVITLLGISVTRHQRRADVLKISLNDLLMNHSHPHPVPYLRPLFALTRRLVGLILLNHAGTKVNLNRRSGNTESLELRHTRIRN